MSRLTSALLLGSVAASAVVAADNGETREESPSAPTSRAQVRAERDLLEATSNLAVAGDNAAAWRALTADVADGLRAGSVSPARLGWRAASVAGHLRNENRVREAYQFARFALAQRWCDMAQIRDAKERAEIRYWSAWLAAEITGDRKLALEWIEQADTDDPDSDRIMGLRLRLTEAAAEFPEG